MLQKRDQYAIEMQKKKILLSQISSALCDVNDDGKIFNVDPDN